MQDNHLVIPKEPFWLGQVLPIFLTTVTFLFLLGLLYLIILGLNASGWGTPVVTRLRSRDIAVGMTIYLKTSVDFAIFIGNLIKTNPGYKSRIAVETGTALGNAIGTIIILILWDIFKELDWLLALMIFLASLVLLKLAEDGLVHAKRSSEPNSLLSRLSGFVDRALRLVNSLVGPLLKRVVPHISLNNSTPLKFLPLLGFAFTIPFILGMDDFAGYVPLFSVINVFGFAAGVLLGHMILNIFLYLSPFQTIRAVTNPVISLIGSLVFIGLAAYGFVEVVRILFEV